MATLSVYATIQLLHLAGATASLDVDGCVRALFYDAIVNIVRCRPPLVVTIVAVSLCCAMFT